LLVKTTSSVDAVHGALLMVQRKVALVPAGTPVTVEVRDDGVVMVAVPLITLHKPEPMVGALAERVNDPTLQLDKSAPAFAVVGDWTMVTACEAVAVQPSAEVTVTV
jgi:hypothetical protein